jgi:hypothetical protein
MSAGVSDSALCLESARRMLDDQSCFPNLYLVMQVCWDTKNLGRHTKTEGAKRDAMQSMPPGVEPEDSEREF